MDKAGIIYKITNTINNKSYNEIDAKNAYTDRYKEVYHF
jgi:hypothetical protein